MKVIVISNSESNEEEPKIICKLFENGLSNFHLRKPKLSTKELKKYIEEIPKKYHNRIIIHSHHSLAIKYNLKGIHLTKTHKKEKRKTWLKLKILAWRKPDIEITTSFSKLSRLYEENMKVDYAFLSPIFDSLTGKYQSGFNEQSLKKGIEKTNYKVIARGGVDVETLEKVKNIGFHGVALYSCIWKRTNPVDQFHLILDKFKALGIEIE